jgi:hypothetical protein
MILDENKIDEIPPSSFCGGMYCCKDKKYDSKDPRCQECDDDYVEAMMMCMENESLMNYR